MLRLLHDLGLSWQKARPIHPEADRKAQARFKKIPGADRRGRPRPPRGRAARGLVPDEARVGQTGRVCRRWFERGMRPRGVRDLRDQAVYLFGAVCPERAAGVALVLPTVSTAAMQAMLEELAQAVSPGAHAVVLMDRAGWHIARDLAVPANLTPVFLPAYSPELNAIERVWLYLRERFLSQRLWPSYDDILEACCAAWNALLAETGRIRSLGALDWAAPVSS
jgi:transposase